MRNFFRALVSLSVLGAFVYLELRRPLRSGRESKLKRNARNLAVAALSAATVQLVEKPIVWPLANQVDRKRWGLLKVFRLPNWVDTLLGVSLLDYTLYVWHILTHRVPWLWRFHAVHHVDLDMDASTALRFHFGELAIAVIWRAGQILVLGISPTALTSWQTALSLSILFHHSNVRLPIGIERMLNKIVVTPRMHGIHHSVAPEEANSNWSSGLTIWDRLHGTLRLNVPQKSITIGVQGFQDPEQVTLPKLLVLPLERGKLTCPTSSKRSSLKENAQLPLLLSE